MPDSVYLCGRRFGTESDRKHDKYNRADCLKRLILKLPKNTYGE